MGKSKKNTNEEDTSGCPVMEGILKKKNSHGVWKDRYCLFSNAYFLTYKPKGKKPSSELKESIHLKDAEEVSIKGDTMTLSLRNGDILLFQGANLKDWCYALDVRMNWAYDQYQRSLEKSGASSADVHISGWLMKKSHNKYQGFQDRFVKVEGNFLRYYKREQDTEELGSTDLSFVSSVRPYDQSSDCRIFEVQEADRTFIFQASNTKEMMHWIQTLEDVRSAILNSHQQAAQAQMMAETPASIRAFDELGEEKYAVQVREQLEELYPEDETMTIREHVDGAGQLLSYLNDLVPEVQKCARRPARYDVLALTMTLVNDVISKRFFTFLPNSFQAEKDNYERSELLELASLGDLHVIIDWLTNYQKKLKMIRCPVYNQRDTSNPPITAAACLSTTYLTPKSCEAFDVLPVVCKLYVYGGSTGAKGGAAAHLYDHCMKVWDSVVSNPEEMLQRRNDGSFYTHAPIDMWEAINQHIALATATKSPILHVMVADKVVTSLNNVFNMIIQYVNTLDTSQRPELREIELEYISALANDTALHIEEVIELIENFTIAEIRERIDEIFDPLTTNLVNCGQACLKRLARLVMSDVQGSLDAVFTEDWLEGNQMHVATATISDYMNDFEEYLVTFWADKFVHTILEEVILTYTRSIIFKTKKSPASTTAPPAVPTSAINSSPSSPAPGGFMSFFSRTKQTIQSIAPIIPVAPLHVPVDAESIGRLAQDVNILNAFFSQKTSQQTATEFLEIINEVSLMMFLDLAGIIKHVALRISEYPSAAQAIREVAIAVMRMRPNDFDKSKIDILAEHIQPVIDAAPADARKKEVEGIVEGRLGLLYIDVVPKSILNAPSPITLARRLKMMSNIPLFGGGTPQRDEEDDIDENADEDVRDREGSIIENAAATNHALLNEVMEVLNQQEEAEAAEIEQREQAAAEEEMAKHRIGMLSYQGYLEKKSPAHNLWQRRFFKVQTRETGNPNKPYVYFLIWYKKEGGAAIKSLEVDKIGSLSISQCSRSLLYIPPPDNRAGLWLQSEAGVCPYSIAVSAVEGSEDDKGAKQVGSEFFVFNVVQTDGKEHTLRGMKIDRIIKWINIIAQAGGLAYDAKTKSWNRTVVDYYEQLASDRASQPSFMTVASTPLPRPRSTRSLSSASSGHSGGPAQLDSEQAAALIQAARVQERERLNSRTRSISQEDVSASPRSNRINSETAPDEDSISDQTSKEKERQAKEEKLRKEKELLRKKLQEEQQLEQSVPSTPLPPPPQSPNQSAPEGSFSNPILITRANSSSRVLTSSVSTSNPLHRARESSVVSSNDSTVLPLQSAEDRSSLTSVPSAPSTSPGPPSGSSTPTRPVSFKKSPAMKRAANRRLKTKGAVGGSSVDGGDKEGGEFLEERPSEIMEERPSEILEEEKPEVIAQTTSPRPTASGNMVDLERETVDLSHRSYAHSEIRPVQTSTISPKHSRIAEDHLEDVPSASSSIVSVDLDDTHNPMQNKKNPNSQRVSFADGVKRGDGKPVQSMEVSQSKTDSKGGPCDCCLIA